MRYREFNPTRTLPQQMAERAASRPDEVALAHWQDGAAQPVTWHEYHRIVSEIALGLARQGVGPGDRVAIMSDARREWVFAALAAQSVGAIALGVYPTNSASEVQQVLAHSDAVAFIGERAGHLEKVASVAAQLPELKLVVGIEEAPVGLPADKASATLEELAEAGAREAAQAPNRFGEMVARASIDDAAVLFYTSGSTGTPKGVTHTHRSLHHAGQSIWGYYPDMDEVRRDAVGFLPLAHVAPAVVLIVTPLITRMVVTFCRMDEYEEVLRAVRPDAVLWPPRFFEKLASSVLAHLETWSPERRRAYDEAMEVGRQVVQDRWDGRTSPEPVRRAYEAALESVFRPLRAEVGFDRMDVAWTASAPMPPTVMALWQIWGVDLRENYGLTETGGAVTGHYEMAFNRPGDIGVVFPDPRWAVKRAEDGEMLLKSASLFREYWKNPEETARVMEDGWFKTGDLIELESDGRIRLVGRKKDVIITSGGKTISPQPMEVSLKESALVGEAVVVGDGRKYLTVLLEVDREAVERELGADADDAQLQAALQAEVDRVNADLARAQQIKTFRVLPRPLAVETGERTANMKMKREGVVTSFAGLIDDMYGSEEADAIAGHARVAP